MFIACDIDEAVVMSDRTVGTFHVPMARPRRYGDVAATEPFMRLNLATLDLLKGTH